MDARSSGLVPGSWWLVPGAAAMILFLALPGERPLLMAKPQSAKPQSDRPDVQRMAGSRLKAATARSVSSLAVPSLASGGVLRAAVGNAPASGIPVNASLPPLSTSASGGGVPDDQSDVSGGLVSPVVPSARV